MQVLQAPRKSGKTTALIQASALTGAVIVTFSKSMAESIRRRAHEFNLTIPTPLTYSDILGTSHRLDGHKDIKVLIDDLDIFLQHVTATNVDVVGATSSPDSKYLLDTPVLNKVPTPSILNYCKFTI